MSTKESFKIIQKMAETARASWAIWFQIYCYHNSGHKFSLVLSIHAPLFDATFDACRHVTMMHLDELFKGRGDTHCFKTLIAACEADGWLQPRILDECNAKLDSLKREIRGVGILRGNHFGHRSNKKDTEEFFKMAGLKIADIDTLNDAANFLLWKLAYAALRDEIPEIPDNTEESIKGSLEDVLQCLLEKFNRLGGATIGKEESEPPPDS